MSRAGYLSITLGILFWISPFSVFGEDEEADSSEPAEIEENGEDEGHEPNVFADVSDESIDSAVSDSFKGAKIGLGLTLGKHKTQASADNVASFTTHKMDIMGISARIDYSKVLKNDFTLGLEGGVDFSKKKKHTGEAKKINAALNTGAGDDTLITGKIESPQIVPSVAVKGGLSFPKYKLSGYVKLGMTRITTKYVYYNDDGQEIVNLNPAKFIPFLCLGIEKKFNPKWGAAFEFDMSLKKQAKKAKAVPGTNDIQLHKIKQNRANVRLMATYSLPSGGQ